MASRGIRSSTFRGRDPWDRLYVEHDGHRFELTLSACILGARRLDAAEWLPSLGAKQRWADIPLDVQARLVADASVKRLEDYRAGKEPPRL